MPRTPYPCRTCGKPRPPSGTSKPDGQCRACISEQYTGRQSEARKVQQQKLKSNYAVPQKGTAKPHPGSWWLVPPDQFASAAKDQRARLILENRGSVISINTVDQLQ